MKNKNIILISLSAITAAFIIYKLLKKPSTAKENAKKSNNIILIGGLDTRKGDKNINEQVELVKKGINGSYNVEGFRYTDLNGALNALNKTPNSYVLLFSAGCVHAEKVAKKLKELNQNLSNLYIAEPYNAGATTKSVQNAVSLGVPQSNVYVGSSSGTGVGIVNNPSKTPKCSPNHWCALTEITKIITTKN